ncbi:MAG TPA: hypothetical protein VIM01_09165 [Dermatophilaceae bacterium]
MSTPRESLEITQMNTPPPAGEDWATDIVNGSSSAGDSAVDIAIKLSKGNAFPVCDREWTQVGAPGEDYELDPVGFAGWLLRPEISGADLPFSHPFDFDWECMVALDPEYSSLLALGNRIPDGQDGQTAVEEAGSLGVPIPDGGLLAVETDGRNVPSAFKNFDAHVVPGDRIAVFGRWIVDTGHSVDLTPPWQPSTGAPPPLVSPPPLQPTPPGPPPVGGGPVIRDHRRDVEPAAVSVVGDVRDHRGGGAAPEGGGAVGRVGEVTDHRSDVGRSSFRSEVHPPLMMAVGGTRQEADGTEITRILVTSRPYLVSQLFTTDTDSIYDDGAGNDGTFLHHMDNELDKLTGFIPESTVLEAHPKITSKPFQGTHGVRLTVRPPAAAPLQPHPVGPGRLGGLGGVLAGSTGLQASFQFTQRTGVAVQVTMDDEQVEVWISMNSNEYIPPPLPVRHDDWWSKDRLDALQSGGGDLLTFEEVVTGLSSPWKLGSVITAGVEEYFLTKGILTDLYDASDVDVLDRSQAVEWARPENVQPGQGIVSDDSQPYPVFGFIEVRHSAVGGLQNEDVGATAPLQVQAFETPGGTT